MKHSFTFFLALALALPTFGAPQNHRRHVIKRSATGDKVPDSYIVVMKEGTLKTDQLVQLKAIDTDPSIDGNYKLGYDKEFSGVLNAYSAHLTGAALEHVLSDPNVDWIEENGISTINFSEGEEVSRRDNGLHEEFIRELRARGPLGEGVVVYGIDTGIRTTHQAFGGRAIPGKAFGPFQNIDGNGHGTHTAATAVGNVFGVATAAKIIGIKVLADNGSGANADVLAGISFAVQSAVADGNPSIITMSLGGGASRAIDTAVQNGINQGVHFTVAAGNENQDAANTSPARVPGANTIGAVDAKNVKASFSNFGEVVDCFAPGVNIKSAFFESDTATKVLSGTSMATPFAAGLLAISLGNNGDDAPDIVSEKFLAAAKAVVKGAPAGTTNLLCASF